MKLEKAIEIETIHNDHNPDFTDAEREQAHQISIEAMKHHKKLRDAHPYSNYKILPGETDD